MFPVLGQQSKRELTLTGRTNKEMIDNVVWHVFRSGYENGYAIDGDHLKTLEDVLTAIYDGVTMITLDCSDYINDVAKVLVSTDAERICRVVFSENLINN